MAVVEIKDNVRLKLELDGGMDGNKQIIKSKTYSRIKPEIENDDLYTVASSIAGLQNLPLFRVKRLEEIQLKEE